MAQKKAWLFIDGYNFYYSIKKSPNLHLSYSWCDFKKLAINHLLDNSFRLERIKYFTAPVTDARLQTSPGEGRRQAIWIEALKTIDFLEVVKGYHRPDELRLRKEKLTDVNIAVELLLGATQYPAYDKAILISGDADLIPAVAAVTKRINAPKLVDVWLPPNAAQSPNWRRYLDTTRVRIQVMDPAIIFKSRFPDKISYKGRIIECDPRWKTPLGLQALKLLNISKTKTKRNSSTSVRKV
jgi:uncharacterized LabA/DUF88 family protein